MPKPRRISKRRLLSELRALLESPLVHIRRGKLRKEHGTAVYTRDDKTGDITNIKIVVDSRNSPVVSITIHELLHVYMAMNHKIDLEFTEFLEEAIIKGLTCELESYIHDSKNEKIFKAWVKVVEEKLQ